MDTSPVITVPLPTVTGRESYLIAAEESYEKYADVELLIFTDYPSCGKAWLEGIQHGSGDYFHMGADDVEMHPDWWRDAIRMIDLGFLPAARILNTDGSLQSCGGWGVEEPNGTVTEFTRSPFFSRKQWERMEPLVAPILGQLHYYSDNVFTWAGRMCGFETVICRRYEYTHHMAPEMRGAGMTWNKRMEHDHKLLVDYIERTAL